MHYSAESLPFVLEFFTDHKPYNTKQVKEFWNRGGVSPKSITDLLTVKEEVPIGARLYAKAGYEADPKGKLVIESSTYTDDGDPVFIEVGLSDSMDQSYLFKHEKQHVFPWRLGVYYFDVHYHDHIYSSAILVIPIHLSKEQVQHMHLVLEQEIEGISYELVFTSKSTGNEYELLHSKTYYDYVLKLMNEKEKPYAALAHLERNLKTEVRTEYTVNAYQRKIDHKSLRWKEMHASSFELNKKKTLALDIPANQWIKHVISLWKNELNRMGMEIQRDWEKQHHVIRSSEEERKRHEERKNSWIHEREVSQESKDSMTTISYRLNDAIKKAEKQMKVLSKWMELIQNMHGRFGYTLSSTGLSEVSRAPKKPQLKDLNYRLISELYEQSKKSLAGEAKSNHFIRVLKPTWKVYEQFVFFQLVEILRRIGFSMRSLYKVDELREMPSGFRVELESEEFLVHVWYDKVIYMREDALERGDFFFSSRLIQPDMRVDLYKNEEQPIFLSTLAMDAKHRRYKSLHNVNYSSNVYSQLSKYSTIFYRGKHTAASYRRPVVDQVLCVYSRDRDADIKKEEHPLTFIQLFPEIDQDQITGFSELMQEITSWIEESKDH